MLSPVTVTGRKKIRTTLQITAVMTIVLKMLLTSLALSDFVLSSTIVIAHLLLYS
jgi:hypothetical protein